jgi:hypothetical protein
METSSLGAPAPSGSAASLFQSGIARFALIPIALTQSLSSFPLLLCLFAIFRSRRSLDDPHRVLVQIANLRGLLEFGGSCNGIEAA